MTTFSQLVDAIVAETNRPDMVDSIAAYLNQTIREAHFDPESEAAIFYRMNRVELQIAASGETSFSWSIPDTGIWQGMGTVQYPAQFSDGKSVYPTEETPGRGLNSKIYFYYQVGESFAFSGFGGLNAPINLLYYQYPRRLLYKTDATRPAWYDAESGWQYAEGIDTPELQLAARTICSNWLLMRWADVIGEGLRAKVYKRLSDDNRARTCYSMYKSLLRGLMTSEAAGVEKYL